MTQEITKFKRFVCILTLEKILYDVQKFIVALLKNKHPKKKVKYKYRILERLKLIKSQLLKNNDMFLFWYLIAWVKLLFY